MNKKYYTTAIMWINKILIKNGEFIVKSLLLMIYIVDEVLRKKSKTRFNIKLLKLYID